MLDEIETSGANRNHIEAQKIRIQIALMSAQQSVDLFIEDQTERRAASEAAEAEKRAKAAVAQSRSLNFATWVLAGATIVLVIATVVSAVK
jgi:hypothetical protein